jgi:hypothetical protein
MLPVVLENEDKTNMWVVNVFLDGISFTEFPFLPPRTSYKKLMA